MRSIDLSLVLPCNDKVMTLRHEIHCHDNQLIDIVF